MAESETTDLVAELRLCAEMMNDGHEHDPLVGRHDKLMRRAADEIERLRAAIESALGYHQTTHIHTVLRGALNVR